MRTTGGFADAGFVEDAGSVVMKELFLVFANEERTLLTRFV